MNGHRDGDGRAGLIEVYILAPYLLTDDVHDIALISLARNRQMKT